MGSKSYFEGFKWGGGYYRILWERIRIIIIIIIITRYDYEVSQTGH
jgi:hypothetical protein